MGEKRFKSWIGKDISKNKQQMEIITLSSGEKADELRNRMLKLINEYSNILTGYELIGIIDVVRNDCHVSIQEMDKK